MNKQQTKTEARSDKSEIEANSGDLPVSLAIMKHDILS
jgi:hypothetical protein